MAKNSSSYTVSPGSAWGRIGTSVGQGLAEQIPKEAERYRLKSGLEELSNTPGLSQTQQMAKLLAIPGITPQGIQSFGDLLRQQQLGNAYGNTSGKPVAGNQVTSSRLSRPEGGQSNLPIQAYSQEQSGNEKTFAAPGRTPQIVEDNPVNPKGLNIPPWTREQKNKHISDLIIGGFTPAQAKELAAEDEASQRAEPEVYRNNQDYLTKKKDEALTLLDKELRNLLQVGDQTKEKDPLHDQLSGDFVKKLQQELEREIRLDPNTSLGDAVSRASKRGLEMAKTKTELKGMISDAGFFSFFRGDNNKNRLQQFSKQFKEQGNSEELQSLLQADMNMSKEGAARVAFPPSKEVQNIIYNYKDSKAGAFYRDAPSRRLADEISEKISGDDSLLSIAYELSDKFPWFNKESFLDEITQKQDKLSLNPRQKDELNKGKGDVFPNWGDLLVHPFKKSSSSIGG